MRVTTRATCRDCRETVQWVTMTYGKSRMIDVVPSAGGNVILIGPVDVIVNGRRIESVLAAKVDGDELREAARRHGAELHRFHLESCPANRQRQERHR